MIVIVMSSNSIPKWIILLTITNDQILWNMQEKITQLYIFVKHKKFPPCAFNGILDSICGMTNDTI
jgi:hypothetical protein